MRKSTLASLLALLIACHNVVSGGDESPSGCGIYLAESAIPHAGLGMYAGKEFKAREQVTDGDIAIPLFELHSNNGNEDFPFIYDDYHWGAATMEGMVHEEVHDEDEVMVTSNGIGAVINCRISMVNIELSSNKISYGGLHRSKSPGAGSITPYHDWYGIAKEDITAGRELYISYGQQYFESRQDKYGLIPWVEDFMVADGLLKKLTKLLPDRTSSTHLSQGLLNMITELPFESAVLNALPINVSDIKHVVQMGAGKHYDATRDIEWLEEHGVCMDNIKPGDSTIKDAGRGAFATRFIPRGRVVAPVPLLHITNKTQMHMYNKEKYHKNGLFLDRTSSAHEQLLVNYCFGHVNSSLLLSPYGMFTGLINHSSKKPNVRLEWSSEIMLHPEWRNLSLKELDGKDHGGLAFDFVALCDIQEGDEILLDYGSEWEEAWDDHVSRWKPPKDADKYIPAFDLENNVDGIVHTIHEEPYSGNVLIYLHDEYRAFLGINTYDSEAWPHPRVLDRYKDSNNETVYMVETYHDVEDEQREMTFVTYDKEILFGVPRDAFQFLDAQYSRDHFDPGSFRHPIMIPSDIMPTAWMDLV